jgi:DNA-binding NarL/FixJ family response regulator
MDEFAESCLDAVLAKQSKTLYASSRISLEEQEEIRALYSTGLTVGQVADEMHYSKSAIGVVVKGMRKPGELAAARKRGRFNGPRKEDTP